MNCLKQRKVRLGAVELIRNYKVTNFATLIAGITCRAGRYLDTDDVEQLVCTVEDSRLDKQNPAYYQINFRIEKLKGVEDGDAEQNAQWLAEVLTSSIVDIVMKAQRAQTNVMRSHFKVIKEVLGF
jgi:hypothetical protein